MSDTRKIARIAVIGGGPAGLMAAESATAAGVAVDLYEGKGSVGRKFLIAGKGGLNLTHSEPLPRFVQRFGDRSSLVEPWLRNFGPDALRSWAGGLGIETFVGSSGRIFPLDLKAAPLLRAWVRRLRTAGVNFHVRHRWLGWNDEGELRFESPAGESIARPAATVLALGGGSWAELGADGAWLPWLREHGIAVAPLAPSNCGFDVQWSAHFALRHAGAPLKRVVASVRGRDGQIHRQQGEMVISADGVEGQLVYALSGPLRMALEAGPGAVLELDLLPAHDLHELTGRLSRARGSRTLTEHWRRNAGIDSVRAGLLHESLGKESIGDSRVVARTLKALPLRVLRPRPLNEAISSAGGVLFDALDAQLMLRVRHGTFCAGEMIDWEAPTGGYLLTACMASGRVAGAAAADWATSTSA